MSDRFAFLEQFGIRVRFSPGHKDVNVFCPIHGEGPGSRTRSLSISRQGLWRCHSAECGAKGRGSSQLRKAIVAVMMSLPRLKRWHQTLLESKRLLRRLKKRGLSTSTIKRYLVGHDGRRYTLPVFSKSGKTVNVRLYSPDKKPKMLPLMAGLKEAVSFYPLRPKPKRPKWSKYLIFCEGEFDALITLQNGLHAVTLTAGVSTWNPRLAARLIELAKGRPIAVIHDMNDKEDAGQVWARRKAEDLVSLGARAKAVKLPLKNRGGDLTDFFTTGHDTKELVRLIKRTGRAKPGETAPKLVLGQLEIQSGIEGEPSEVSLEASSSAQLVNQRVIVRCLTVGKDLTPYLVPKRIKVSCLKGEAARCSGCALENARSQEVQVPKECSLHGSVVDRSKRQADKAILEALSVPCPSHVEVLESQNLERLYVVPDPDSEQNAYTVRELFYLGQAIQTSRCYVFQGFTSPSPLTHRASLFGTEAEMTEGALDSFRLTTEVRQRLQSFSVPGLSPTRITKRLLELAELESSHVTKIYGRPDLHLTIDLVFHSLLSFNLGSERVEKGYLEALIIGDTRTGKGLTASRLSEFYRLGEVVSGEACSFAGLVGGVQKLGDRWALTWGKLPLNDRRLVVIDEASSLTFDEIARLSRVRSEGMAEITKIRSERTRARVRLIWLANPRPLTQGVSTLSSYGTGVDAICHLIGTSEDIARFDLYLTLSGTEVEPGLINQPRPDPGPLPIPAQAFRELVLWAWTRKPDQVSFSKKAVEAAHRLALEVSSKYSSRVPLIQTETARIKIARLAAAIAARLYSAGKTGEVLKVAEAHILVAASILEAHFQKPSLSYDLYSESAFESEEMDEEGARSVVENLGASRDHFIIHLLSIHRFEREDIEDAVGCAAESARSILSALVRARAIARQARGYVKTRKFVELLQKIRREDLE